MPFSNTRPTRRYTHSPTAATTYSTHPSPRTPFSSFLLPSFKPPSFSPLLLTLLLLVFLLVFAFLHHGHPTLFIPPAARFPEWRRGYLDIHHLRLGPEQSTYIVLPDGTQLLVDLGELDVAAQNSRPNRSVHSVPKYPDASPAADRAWRAMRRVAPRLDNGKRQPSIDYVLVTHFHGDHVGSRKLASRRKGEDYTRVGVIDYILRHDVQRVYDRGTYLPWTKIPTIADIEQAEMNPRLRKVRRENVIRNYDILNYLAFRRHLGNDRVHALIPCTSNQIIPLYSTTTTTTTTGENNTTTSLNYSTPVQLRTLKAGRLVCDSATQRHVKIPIDARNENLLSVSFELSYGSFRYLETGDNEHDSLTPISTAGLGRRHRIDVATAGHHAHGVSEELVNWQRPQVFVQQSWCADHTPETQVRRMAGVADVYATDLHPDAVTRLNGYGDGLASRYETMRGQVSVRVYPEEETANRRQRFDVFVVDGRGKVVKRKEYEVSEKE